jgi:hypothetical protein
MLQAPIDTPRVLPKMRCLPTCYFQTEAHLFGEWSARSLTTRARDRLSTRSRESGFGDPQKFDVQDRNADEPSDPDEGAAWDCDGRAAWDCDEGGDWDCDEGGDWDLSSVVLERSVVQERSVVPERSVVQERSVARDQLGGERSVVAEGLAVVAGLGRSA